MLRDGELLSEFRRRPFQNPGMEKRSPARMIKHGEGALKYSAVPSPHITCTYASLAPASEELELVRTGALGGGEGGGGDTVQSQGPGSNVRRFMS